MTYLIEISAREGANAETHMHARAHTHARALVARIHNMLSSAVSCAYSNLSNPIVAIAVQNRESPTPRTAAAAVCVSRGELYN